MTTDPTTITLSGGQPPAPEAKSVVAHVPQPTVIMTHFDPGKFASSLHEAANTMLEQAASRETDAQRERCITSAKVLGVIAKAVEGAVAEIPVA